MHFLSISPFRFRQGFDAMPDYTARGISPLMFRHFSFSRDCAIAAARLPIRFHFIAAFAMILPLHFTPSFSFSLPFHAAASRSAFHADLRRFAAAPLSFSRRFRHFSAAFAYARAAAAAG
jgi:hypothetical protein